jgi:transcriptional regulator with XRE-family HTH domain
MMAINIKQHRCRLGLTQAKLAEKADASTQYVAMIELGRKFPSPEMLERLAIALEIDNLDLFSPPPFPSKNIRKLQKTISTDLERKITKSINKAVQEAVRTVITGYMVEIKNDE